MKENGTENAVEQIVAEKIVLSIGENDLLMPSIAFVFEKVKKHNQGKYSHLSRFDAEEFSRYLLEQGIKTVDNAVDADIERRNKDAYVNAMSKLTPPTDVNNPEALGKYLDQVNKLRVKYGIGGSPQQV